MKILIDIGHPGQVHYFKNAIDHFLKNKHSVTIMARDREYVIELLNKYNLPFINRGKGSNSFFGKLFYMLKADLHILKISLKFKPDLFLSFSSPYAAQVSFLLRKPHIAINDSEHEDSIYSIFTYPFSSYILTPASFQTDLGKKQIRFNNVVEGLYLHKKYFTPNIDIKKDLKLTKDEEYVVLRFVSWNAHHDFGQKGIDLNTKRELIKLLKSKYKIFISSEGELPEEFKKYQIKISPEKIHHVLAYASIFVGESSTMGSESALLGTKAVVINSLPIACNIKIEQEAGIAKYFQTSNGVIEYISGLLEERNLKSLTQIQSESMQSSFINATEFLIWFIENYPDSVKTIKENPDYQLNFK